MKGNNMSVRIQVILGEEEAARFRLQAKKESKSLSAWLREAGNIMLELGKIQPLTDTGSLKRFFKRCNKREKGMEPDWEDHISQ